MSTRKPAEVFPPGDFLREELEARGWTQKDFAAILGRAEAGVNEIISGKRRITAESAMAIAAALGTSPQVWMNLEAAYQLSRLESVGTDLVARRAKLYAKAPVREMIRRGWIESSDNFDVLQARTLSFLEIKTLDEKPFFAHAARKTMPKTTTYDECTEAQLAWLFRARQLARVLHAKHFDKSRIADLVSELRDLVYLPQSVRQVPKLLAEYGVRLVIVEPLVGGQIDGATFWLDKNSPVVALSVRFDRLDNFWFTLLHELYHVREGEESCDIDLRSVATDKNRPEGERMADEVASSTLISKAALDDFIARVRPLYSARRIEAFAQINRVHPAIVVGQLQYRGEVPWASFRPLLVPIRAVITDAAITDGWGSVLPPLS